MLSARAPTGHGEDWSSAHSEEALVAHVRERVDHYLDASTIEQVREGFDAFARAWAA